MDLKQFYGLLTAIRNCLEKITKSSSSSLKSLLRGLRKLAKLTSFSSGSGDLKMNRFGASGVCRISWFGFSGSSSNRSASADKSGENALSSFSDGFVGETNSLILNGSGSGLELLRFLSRWGKRKEAVELFISSVPLSENRFDRDPRF